MSCASVLREAREAIQLEEQARLAAADEREYWARFGRAVLLSPSIDVCEALLHGESVSLDRLDPDWCRRYGLKHAA